MSALFAKGQDGGCGAAFIKEFALEPYFLELRLVEEIVDVPKFFLVFPEVSPQPSVEILFCPPHIEVFTRHEGRHPKFTYLDIKLLF